jgi:hypothetical protein
VCYASTSTGLGSVLLQDGKPIAHASRAVAPAKQRYAQIEKETLTFVFSCVRLNQYVSVKHILVRGNHKPLEEFFTKKHPKHVNAA